MGNTSISWTDKTWNPIRGCSRTSTGCTLCYAEMIAARFSGKGQAYEGLAKMTAKGPRWTGQLKLIEAKLDEPLRWRKRYKVFVNSMSDLFHEKVPFEWVQRIFTTMFTSNRNTYQILTKRPEKMREVLSVWDQWVNRVDSRAVVGEKKGWGAKHIWLGTSVESADYLWRIDELRETPATIRFLSLEPLLGPLGKLDLCGISWAIIGGESGRGARPMECAWAEDIIRQCKDADVAVFFKQTGSSWARAKGFKNSKGEDPEEWPEVLRVREFPKVTQ